MRMNVPTNSAPSLRVRETSGAGISTTQVCVATPHPSTAGRGRHLHRGIDLRSYDSESTRGPANSGAGVSGVAGAGDPFGGVDPGSIPSKLSLLASSLTLALFFWVFIGLSVQQK
uniref:Nip3a n=1 Tax=Arundo donax TaxID=35708 RepID=A0A0A9I2A5_ARUDO